jgi:hypothetical protein
MTDIEGNALEIGEIYLLPVNGNQMILAKYSHETESSYIFKYTRYEFNLGVQARIYSWKRQVAKDSRFNTIMAIKATPKMIERYIES